jgi:hypothetical protein
VKKLPAHQYKIGNKLYGLSQADNELFIEFVNTSNKKTYSEIFDLYRNYFFRNQNIYYLLEAISKKEQLSGVLKGFWHYTN